MSDETEWWKRTTIYQIYPRSFKDSDGDGIGDLEGIYSELDYLASLGIETIWLSPFYDSPQEDFGYDIKNYREVFPNYGTNETLKKIVEKIHELDMKVVFDLVMNHTSIEHEWFIESSSSKDNPKADWYIWRDGKPACGTCYANPFLCCTGAKPACGACGCPSEKPPNNWQRTIGGSGWNYSETRGQWFYSSFLPFQPDLNYRNPEVKAAMFDMVKFWLDFGVDGYRLDIFNSIFKEEKFTPNPPSLRLLPSDDNPDGFFQQFKYTVNQSETFELAKELRKFIDDYGGKERFIVGEVFGNDQVLQNFLGTPEDPGLNLVFIFKTLDFEFNAGFFGDLIEDFEKNFPAPQVPVYAFANHDRPRTQLKLDNSFEQGKVLALLQMTLRGVPSIWMGEEIGMKQGNIDVAEAIDPLAKSYSWLPQLALSGVRQFTGDDLNRDNTRLPFQWKPELPNAGFTTSEAKPWLPVCSNADVKRRNVETQSADEDSILSFYKSVLKFRKDKRVLQEGTIRVVAKKLGSQCLYYLTCDYCGDVGLDSTGGMLGYARELDDEKLLIYINFNDGAITQNIGSELKVLGNGDIVLTTNKDAALEGDKLRLPGKSGVIISC